MIGMIALANKIEKNPVASRDLDLEIMQSISGKAWDWHPNAAQPQTVITWPEYGDGAIGNPICSLERFTSSLDDAMTLIPASCQWTIETDTAWVRCMGRKDVHEAQCGFFGKGGEATIIAVVVAALRARGEMKRTAALFGENGQ